MISDHPSSYISYSSWWNIKDYINSNPAVFVFIKITTVTSISLNLEKKEKSSEHKTNTSAYSDSRHFISLCVVFKIRLFRLSAKKMAKNRISLITNQDSQISEVPGPSYDVSASISKPSRVLQTRIPKVLTYWKHYVCWTVLCIFCIYI